ncbi:MAG: hypothetical protein ACREQ2_22215 [Candidatus Binatia bacterium]
MTYKEHLIFVDVRRDAGDCFWLPLASVCWNEEEKKHVVAIKGRPQDRFVRAVEAENSAIQMAREWVDAHVQNGHFS